jgi:hypothetical protein
MSLDYKYGGMSEEDRNALFPAFKRTGRVLPSSDAFAAWLALERESGQEEQEEVWTSLDEGRSDGQGESYSERNA